MAAEYDRKFEEMKKYVPFLESMIQRLESTNTGSTNPRQAQLNKIRSLRDLLLDKKKRMKMDNLLKCEQVLVNLYAKVEQRDTFSIPANSPETTSLEVVRNKLKTVIKKEDEDNPETLPEIARANESQDDSTAGSKEPALFQRRPNRGLSPGRSVTKSPPGSTSKRNYTRVLVSPEPSPNRWLNSEYAGNDKPLFSRRSPRWSPNRCSPAYSRKERKKTFKSPRKSKDLNITLKVPEESLNSLNTKDILSRIINCNDNDVDIDSLRVLRTQILGELKHTGVKDDISDLILNSTRNRKKKKKKPKQKEEVEEGELSDSQSEAIEDIYGSLVILDKDQGSGQNNVSNNDEQKQNRKIQIRLVINSDSTATSSTDKASASKTLIDLSDFEMYKNSSKTSEVKTNDTKKNTADIVPIDTKHGEGETTNLPTKEAIVDKSYNKNETGNNDVAQKYVSDLNNKNINPASKDSCSDEGNRFEPKKDDTKKGVAFKPNFYTPLTEESNSAEKLENLDRLSDTQNPSNSNGSNSDSKTEARALKIPSDTKDITKAIPEIVDSSIATKTQDAVEIPLLNEPSVATQKPKESVVSEIDILQALKNEILSESITISGTNTITPALHQPKVTKVASAQEIAPKKRISIEKYKEKSVGPAATPLFTKGRSLSKEDQIKRQSLKLTEKEFERFKFALHHDFSSDEDDNDNNNDDTSLDDIYGDLAPKSPDNNDSNGLTSTPPIIIPEDPVKNVVANSKADVDMRTLMPIVSPLMNSGSTLNSLPSPSINVTSGRAVPKDDQNKNNIEKKAPVDPRIKRDLNQINTQNESVVPRPVPPVNFSSLSPAIVPNVIPNMPPCMTPCMTPNVVPNMTPNILPNMTPSMIPNMTPSMTPNSRTFQIDDQPARKHVYATIFDPRDYRDQSMTRDVQSAARDKSEKSQERAREDNDWNDSGSWQDRKSRSNLGQTDNRDYQKYNKYNESYYYKYKNSRGDRCEAPVTPSHPFGRSDCPPTPIHSFSRSDCPSTPSHPFGRSDCPSTPSHPFGRSDCPSTPSHPFGRSDCPSTPSHSFGRSDCPPTPSHPFGRSDCPLTPSHPFGRSECPPTPSHPFGRPECPLTPIHTFGRSECPPTPSNSFGRTDVPMSHSHSLSRIDRDPRLKRNAEYELNIRNDRDRFHRDRDHIRYKDRNTPTYNSYQQDKPYADNYRNYRERSIGQNESNHQYSKEQDDYNYKNERISRSDRYGSVSSSENYDTDPRGHKYNYNDRNKPIRYNEMEPQKSTHRERSIGRTVPSEERFVRSNSRARSVGRNHESDADNTLSIKSHSGRPFTIDTSVNSTFQNLIKRDKDKSVFEHIFDNRKQRATSVGRSLVRETSVGPPQSRSFNPIQNNERRNDFRRARSVVRDIGDSEPNQTFTQIKADFEAFKTKLNNHTKFQKHDLNVCKRYDERNDSPRTGKSEYETHNSKSTSKNQRGSQLSYSPRKNYRDPRLHRDKYYDVKNRHKDDKYNSRDKKKYGIDYSNESIARGTVLETGFGVRNYKIPKIKRATEDNIEKKMEDKTETENKMEVSKEKKEKVPDVKEAEKLKKPDKNIKIKSKDFDSCLDKTGKQTGDSKFNIEDTEKKITRSTKKPATNAKKHSDDEIIVKTRKSKRLIRDSESESEDTSKNNALLEKSMNCDMTLPTKLPENEKETVMKTEQLAKKDKDKNENKQDVDLDASFADDLEIFADNVISDPVIDSINALIADLDDDINTSKNDGASNFRKEISVENMLENITSRLEEENSKESSEDVTLQDINEFIREDLNKSEETGHEHTSNESLAVKEIEITELNSQDCEKLHSLAKPVAVDAEINKMLTNTNIKECQKVHKENQGKRAETQNSHFIEQDTNKHNEDFNTRRAVKEIEITEFNSHDCEKLHSLDKHVAVDAEINKMLINTNVKECQEVHKENQGKGAETQNSHFIEQDCSKHNEDIVSTTDLDSEQTNKMEARQQDHQEIRNCSTPDSTYSANVPTKLIPEETLPDSSTNEAQNENPDVTSSHDSSENKDQQQAEATTNKNETPNVDSIESILCLLKNKAKMKEILNKLGQQSCDNDKVKKKLEKLSEIVSDDEDSNDEKQEHSKTIIEKTCDDSLSFSEKIDNDINTDKNENLADLIDRTFEKENEQGDLENELGETETVTQISNKNAVNKGKIRRKRFGKSKRKKIPKEGKRITRTETTNLQKVTSKNKISRELLMLQEDIKEMFISDDILNATGIRMCRIAKLVDEKVTTQKATVASDAKPVVVLEKITKEAMEETHAQEDNKISKVIKKKPGPKPNTQVSLGESSVDIESKVEQSKRVLRYKPGPKSRKKKSVPNQQIVVDPYAFETDSINESNASKRSDYSSENSSDSENESLTSLKSYGSSEVLAELKRKPKRKRSSWKSGVIKPKQKKKKIEHKQDSCVLKDNPPPKIERHFNIPDLNCFTDKTYCFTKNVMTYSCRLCVYTGDDIVPHYKKQHPHSEIPLSRLSPEVAKEAINQCEQINIQAVSKIPTKRLVCRFCYKEFRKKKSSLEAFFWHVVSIHTGEYKQLCPECINITRCPFNLDIPPPPKDVKGQLIGYICGKCNFTQISLENLKTHVIVRHNDEQTEVYTINLAEMSRKLFNSLLKRTSVPETDQPRVLRSSRSNPSITETSDDRSDYTDTNEFIAEPPSPQIKKRPRRSSTTRTNMQSKITFENDDSASETTVKVEREDHEDENEEDTSHLGEDAAESDSDVNKEPVEEEATVQRPQIPVSDDIFAYPHFKICYSDTGSKEFVCCINGQHHYKTTLLISMKKHVQLKHHENWDGYCFVCKVIVMPQGRHHFKSCIEHFLDKHMDEFPVMEKVAEPEKSVVPSTSEPAQEPAPTPPPRPYINVRPISQLKEPVIQDEDSLGLPKIESVVSLGGPPEQNLSYPGTGELEPPLPQSMEDFNKYEQAQVDVMSKKHPVVLDTMLRKEKLVKVFKCAGSYCSFTTDSADVALIHALCHQQIGGENAMNCAYCDFDTAENAIDLVVHVFKHARCQSVCGYCFYRAACGQLVVAHATRAHPGRPPKVLAATNSVPQEKDTSSILPRNIAVKYYVCNQADPDGTCSFRTFIGKMFCEHLEQRHPLLTEHVCYICFATVSSAADLIQHMKCHDLNFYQCSWCVFGADNDSELLAHSSAKHPTKQPQAYLRVIRNKEGSSEFRVLPLVSVNKYTVNTEEVTPNSTSENPTKEAERSLELEKLIGTTKAMFENMTTSTSHKQNTRESIETFDLDQEAAAQSLLHQECSLTTSPAIQKPQTPVTDNPVTESQTIVPPNPLTEHPQKSVTQQSTQEMRRTSLSQIAEVAADKTPSRVSSPAINAASEPVSLKTELQVSPAKKASDDNVNYKRYNETVYCLESDDETLTAQTTTAIIDLSDDDDVTESTTDVQSTPAVESQSTPIEDSHSVPTVESQSIANSDPENAPTVEPTKQSVDPGSLSKQSLDPGVAVKESADNTKSDNDANKALSNDPNRVRDDQLFKCPKCKTSFKGSGGLKVHILSCLPNSSGFMLCAHCGVTIINKEDLVKHYIMVHQIKSTDFACSACDLTFANIGNLKRHMKNRHSVNRPKLYNTIRDGRSICIAEAPPKNPSAGAPRRTSAPPTDPSPVPRLAPKRKSSTKASEPSPKLKRYGPQDVDQLPINPILDELVSCSLCEFKTKVRLNLVRHLQLHADRQPAPQTAPVNPVPHLETNEMHFDKMLNLASSSIVTRVPEKQTRPDAPPVVSLHIPPELAFRYPKYVPERQRHTCGAKGCSYISVDEAMLRCHWDTLHSGSNDYHCVHCPPQQSLDTSKPLTASRIILHLKMHDTTLYACSACPYYHYKRQFVEKHVNETHKGASVLIVREEVSQSISTSTAAPTMDLKPWQCGLCKFKSMLRQEVVEHCAKVHQSKMQYKCSYCPFRTSTLENVVKHQSNSHPGKVEEVFYYYYREGSVQDEADGTPRWMKQRQKTGTTDPEVKTEVSDSALYKMLVTPSVPTPPAVSVDLNIVKKEVDAKSPSSEQSIEELCKTFGEFCEPNGLKYKCCLCKVVTEDTKEAMQSHMYEELQYRKWRCNICSYKAFHKTGLHDHMTSEHRGQVQDPLELPVDVNIEKWVAKMLEHQAQIIQKNKDNFAKQKIQVPTPSTSKVAPVPQVSSQETSTRPKFSMKELEQAFGQLGVANNMQFCCPKCVFRNKDEGLMKDHLESELSKIRWCCSVCSENFTTYHEVQFHCRTSHDGQSARPKEAIRDPAMRAAWVAAVIQVQKLSMNCMPIEPLLQPSPQKQPPEPDNSLLVVRFEETVPIPEGAAKKRPLPQSPDSDEERLVIDEVAPKKTATYNGHKCPHCPFQSKYTSALRTHIFKHYNMQPHGCQHCNFTGLTSSKIFAHVRTAHPNKPLAVKTFALPTGPPVSLHVRTRKSNIWDDDLRGCMVCKTMLSEVETLTHRHVETLATFAKHGDVVYRCSLCKHVRKDLYSMQIHYRIDHSDAPLSYTKDQVRLYQGDEACATVQFINFDIPSIDLDDSSHSEDSFSNVPPKRVAKKSTTKLPMQAVAKKSTTKLPLYAPPECEEYSYYGTKPTPLNEYANVSTMMLFCNTMVPFNIQKLSEIINIEPKVTVKDKEK